MAALNDPQPDPTPLERHRLRRDRMERLERHLEGLRAHLEAIGLWAEASAVRTELDLIRAIR